VPKVGRVWAHAQAQVFQPQPGRAVLGAEVGLDEVARHSEGARPQPAARICPSDARTYGEVVGPGLECRRCCQSRRDWSYPADDHLGRQIAQALGLGSGSNDDEDAAGQGKRHGRRVPRGGPVAKRGPTSSAGRGYTLG
jgi:hypothetical protein